MEQSAYEAIMIGVNAFVFIIALTASILLMSNVIDMVNYANEQAIVGMNGSLAESVGIVNERLYDGKDILTYYKEEQKNKEEERVSTSSFNVKLEKEGQIKKLDKFVEETPLNDYISKTFLLQYEGVENSKDLYTFIIYEQPTEE